MGANTMDFDLSDDHELIRRTVRDFAEGEVAPVAEELDRDEGFPYEIVRHSATSGSWASRSPRSTAGRGADSLAYAIAVEELDARGLLGGDHAVRAHVAGYPADLPVRLRGAEARVAAASSAPGRRLGAFGLTEPEAGSDAGNARTRARLDDGEWVINGAKQFITNAGTDISGMVTHHARTGDDEISNLIVAERHARLRRRASRTARWAGTRPTRGRCASTTAACRRRTCSGRAAPGFKQFLHVLDIGRIGVAAMGVGLAQGALDEALAYAKERRAFGQPISKFQAIQAKLADMSTEIEAARLLTYKAARLKDAGRNFTLTAAQAKLKTGRLAVRAAEEAVQIHGGYGYIEEYPVCRFYRDAKILTIGEGTDEVQQMVIARALGA